MLVLNRKKGESIVVADQIEITVVEVGNDQVKIGITAPREIKIYRQEIYREVMEANRGAVRNLDGIGGKIEQFIARGQDWPKA
jgi:carbon storage regulator